MSQPDSSAATASSRTLHWFGDKSREELLLEIDRIITTDKPALAALYEKLDRLVRALSDIADTDYRGNRSTESVRAHRALVEEGFRAE